MIPITVRAMSRYLAYRNAPRLAAYLAPPVTDIVSLLRPARPDPQIAERFWSKVDMSAGPLECWPWTARRTALGYGDFSVRNRSWKASRVAWTLTAGPIPDGLLVLHDCDNPPCVNPAHLHLGTHADNMAEKAERGRARNVAMTKTHCIRGHELIGDRRRPCRPCGNMRSRAFQKRHPGSRCLSRRKHDDVVTRLRPAPRSAPVHPGHPRPHREASRTPEQNRQPRTRARDAVAAEPRPAPPPSDGTSALVLP